MDVLRTWEGNIVLRICGIFKKVSVVALDQNILFFIFWTSPSHMAGLLFHGRQGNKATTNFCCCLALSNKTEWLQSITSDVRSKQITLLCIANFLALILFFYFLFLFYFIFIFVLCQKKEKTTFLSYLAKIKANFPRKKPKI